MEHTKPRAAWRHRGKPLFRGWSHAAAVVGAIAVTTGFVYETRHDTARLVSLLIFGLSMIALYSFSSLYHLGRWNRRHEKVVRALDHAGIFLLIAGTYTPICVIVLEGAFRVMVLALIWGLAAVGIMSSVLTLRLPRWAQTALYLGMGWMALIPLPDLLRTLPWQFTALLAAGGLLYSAG